MRKKTVGISFCILLIVVAMAPAINASVLNENTAFLKNDIKANLKKENDPEQVGFSDIWATGPIGVKIFGRCNKYNYNTLDIKFESVSGRLYFAFGPRILKEEYDGDFIYTFVYWYILFGIGKFHLILEFEESNGSKDSITIEGQVRGILVTNLDRID